MSAPSGSQSVLDSFAGSAIHSESQFLSSQADDISLLEAQQANQQSARRSRARLLGDAIPRVQDVTAEKVREAFELFLEKYVIPPAFAHFSAQHHPHRMKLDSIAARIAFSRPTRLGKGTRWTARYCLRSW